MGTEATPQRLPCREFSEFKVREEESLFLRAAVAVFQAS